MPDNGRRIWQRLVDFRRRRLQRAVAVSTTGGPPNPIPPLSHGYVHEPFSGAWQQNIWCRATDPANFSAVFACVQIISTDVAKLVPVVYRRLEDGSKEPHPNHPAQRVLLHPNEYQTRVDFFQQLMASILLVGPSYTWLSRDERNVVDAMYPLNPYRTTPVVADDGSIFFEAGYAAHSSLIPYDWDRWDRRAYIPARDIMYHRELSAPGNPLAAISPLSAALTSATTGSLILSQQQAFYENMSRASGVLTAPHKISKETADRLRVEWEQNFKAGSLGRVAVLGEGLEWKALALTAVDSQLIDSLKWTVSDIARVFRVPDYMLGIGAGGSQTSKSAEQMTRNYYAQTLSYHLEALEVRLGDALDLAPDVFIEFDMSGLLRADFDVRMLAYKNAINSGVYSINELRRMEELAPMAGGEQPLIQVQYVPLSTLAERHAAATKAPTVPVQPTTPTATPAPTPTPPPPSRSVDEDEDLAPALAAGLGDMLRHKARRRLKEKL